MVHVFGHMDRFLSARERSDEENINVECDALAETALSDGILREEFIDLIFPEEEIVAIVDSTKITGNAVPQILRHWGDGEARKHFISKGILDSDTFDWVDWDGAEQVLETSPEMFSTWAVNFVSLSAIEKEIKLETIEIITIENIKITRTLSIISNKECYRSKALEFFYNELWMLKSITN